MQCMKHRKMKSKKAFSFNSTTCFPAIPDTSFVKSLSTRCFRFHTVAMIWITSIGPYHYNRKTILAQGWTSPPHYGGGDSRISENASPSFSETHGGKFSPHFPRGRGGSRFASPSLMGGKSPPGGENFGYSVVGNSKILMKLIKLSWILQNFLLWGMYISY